MFAVDDTIVAVSTPPGRGALGLVRLSGPQAQAVAVRLVGRRAPFEPRRATFARVREDGGSAVPARPIDQVVCTWFPAPRSYTGEDSVEITGHGNPFVLARIVRLAVDAGARLAEPGEFTLRAFLNGRIDLPQAEAVRDLIEAVTPLQARVAFDQLEGTITGAIAGLEQSLFELSARLEASLDFPDEGYHFVDGADAVRRLDATRGRVAELLAGAGRGRLIREGRQVAILGRPNVGKSTLFNALLGAARAIVTDVPGTTRDLLTERCDVGGIPVLFVDTAGLRTAAADDVEAQGISRAWGAAGVADLRLVLVDGSAPLRPDDRAILAETQRGPRVVVATKADLPAGWAEGDLPADYEAVRVSARTGAGLDTLRDRLLAALGAAEDCRDAVVITNVRHVALLARVEAALARATASAEERVSEEFVLADIREALEALGEVTGARPREAVLHEIFSRFCIGK